MNTKFSPQRVNAPLASKDRRDTFAQPCLCRFTRGRVCACSFSSKILLFQLRRYVVTVKSQKCLVKENITRLPSQNSHITPHFGRDTSDTFVYLYSFCHFYIINYLFLNSRLFKHQLPAPPPPEKMVTTHWFSSNFDISYPHFLKIERFYIAGKFLRCSDSTTIFNVDKRAAGLNKRSSNSFYKRLLLLSHYSLSP